MQAHLEVLRRHLPAPSQEQLSAAAANQLNDALHALGMRMKTLADALCEGDASGAAELAQLMRRLPAQELTRAQASELEVAFEAISSRIAKLSSLAAQGGRQAAAAELAQLLRALTKHSGPGTALAARFTAAAESGPLTKQTVRDTAMLVCMAAAAGEALRGLEALEQLQPAPYGRLLSQQEAGALADWAASVLPALAALMRHAVHGGSSNTTSVLEASLDAEIIARGLEAVTHGATHSLPHIAARSSLPRYAAAWEQALRCVPLLMSATVPALRRLPPPGEFPL
ncbi:hypothetical protein ABPG75_005553 [Micractinium tetrahymenae]